MAIFDFLKGRFSDRDSPVASALKSQNQVGDLNRDFFSPEGAAESVGLGIFDETEPGQIPAITPEGQGVQRRVAERRGARALDDILAVGTPQVQARRRERLEISETFDVKDIPGLEPGPSKKVAEAIQNHLTNLPSFAKRMTGLEESMLVTTNEATKIADVLNTEIKAQAGKPMRFDFSFDAFANIVSDMFQAGRGKKEFTSEPGSLNLFGEILVEEVKDTKRLFQQVAAGITGVIGGTFEGAGILTDTKFLKTLGEDINREFTENLRVENPDITETLAAGAGSTIAFFFPGAGVVKGVNILSKGGTIMGYIARAAGIGTMSVLEAVAETGEIHEQAIRNGLTLEEADKAAQHAFIANTLWLSLTNALGLGREKSFALKRILYSMPMESIQEAGQKLIANIFANEDDLMKGVVESGIMGAFIGALVGGTTEGFTTPDAGPGTGVLQQKLAGGKGKVDDDLYSLAIQRGVRDGIIGENRLTHLNLPQQQRGPESESRLIGLTGRVDPEQAGETGGQELPGLGGDESLDAGKGIEFSSFKSEKLDGYPHIRVSAKSSAEEFIQMTSTQLDEGEVGRTGISFIPADDIFKDKAFMKSQGIAPDEIVGEVRDIIVHKSIRGKGIGTELIKRMEDVARSRGVKRVNVVVDNPDFFTKMGYKPFHGKRSDRVWTKVLGAKQKETPQPRATEKELSTSDQAAIQKFDEAIPESIRKQIQAGKPLNRTQLLKQRKEIRAQIPAGELRTKLLQEVEEKLKAGESAKQERGRKVSELRAELKKSEARAVSLDNKLRQLHPKKQQELGLKLDPRLRNRDKSQLKKTISAEIKSKEEARENFMQFENSAIPISNATKRDVQTALVDILVKPENLVDITNVEKGGKDVFRIFEKVFRKFSKEQQLKVKKEFLDKFDESKGEHVDFVTNLKDELFDVIVKGMGIRRRSKMSKAVQEWGEGLRDKESIVSEFGDEGFAKVDKADKWFRKKYDDLLDEVNRVRAEIYPRDPSKQVIRRADYFRHFRELTDSLGGLRTIFENPAGISPELVGISDFTRPKTRFLGFSMARLGFKTKLDAVGGMLDYIPAASYAIHIDPHVQRFRALSDALADSTTETKNINNFIEFLQDFSNDLSGKTNPMDRAIQKFLPGGRKAFRVLNWTNIRIKANQILGNASASVAQAFNLPQAVSEIGNPIFVVRGMQIAISNAIKGEQSVMKNSIFLKERYRLSRANRKFNTRILEHTRDAFVEFTMILDEVATRLIWGSFYVKGQAQGLADPIKYADDWTRKMVAGRGIGEVPILQKSQVFQMVAPFQVEVGNAWWVQGDQVTRKQFGKLLYLFILNFLANELAEQIRGNRVTYDPIDAIIDGILNDDDDDEVIVRMMKFTGRQVGEIGSNVPLGQTLAALYPEYGFQIGETRMPSRREFFGEGDPTRFGGGILIAKGIRDPIFKLLTPFGGQQAKRTLEGIKAVRTGQVRSKSGKTKLFSTPKTLTGKAKTVIFGKFSTREARKSFKDTSLLDEILDKKQAGDSDDEISRLINRLEPAAGVPDSEIDDLLKQLEAL